MIRYLGLAFTIAELVLLTLLALGKANAATVRDDVLRESVALIERNAFYDEYGRLIFEQAIFIDFDAKGEEEIRAWRLIKSEAQIPQRDWKGGGYVTRWFDGERTIREVRSRWYRESWTQYDPELSARDKFPKEKRRPLKGER